MVGAKLLRRSAQVIQARRRYWQQVKALFGSSIVAYYRAGETSGSSLVDNVHAYHGTYNGPTLAAVNSPISGEKCPTFDGTNDVIDVKAALDHLTASVAGSIMGWSKIAPAVWTDGVRRSIFSFYNANGTDYLTLEKPTASNILYATMVYGGVTKSCQPAFSSPDDFAWCFTWDKSGDMFKFMLNGYTPYSVLSGLGVWPDGWYPGACYLGGYSAGTTPFKGSESNILIRSKATTEAEFFQFTTLAKHLKRVSIIGDSIEVGWQSWPYLAAASKGYILQDHAIAGINIMAQMDSQVVACKFDNADYIILALGTNDTDGGDMGLLQAKVESSILALKATNPHATLYYQNVLPRWTDNTGATPVVKTNIRAAIAAACTAKGVTCWDTFSTPWITAAQTDDGLHPSAATGHPAVAAQVLSRLP